MSTTPISETYELLVSLLARYPQTIEILPGDGSTWTQDIGSDPSFSPFLFVEANLGIPQKTLYKLYLHAVGIFKSARARPSTWLTMTAQRNHDLDTSLVPILTSSSSVLLLANPSHQTALNSRKHLIRKHLIDPRDELHFMSSLLSSQHCAKHAELWYHRRWLLSTAYASQPPNITNVNPHSRLQFESQGALQRELELVSRTCELYPRNYFAWTHRLICMRSLLSDYLAGTDTINFVSVFRDEIMGTKGWIDRHVSDYSAVHHILVLSHTALQSGESSLIEIITKGDLPGHGMCLVQEYPVHEALWMYVRTALSVLDLWSARNTQEFIDSFVQPLAHSQCDTEDDLVTASKFARLFLNKREAATSFKDELSCIS